MAETSPFDSLDALLDSWSEDVLHGKAPIRWPSGSGALSNFPLGPGLMTLLGGPPGAGKTAIANQLVFDAVRLNPGLKVLVTCCEMSPSVLLDRQLSRLSGVPYTLIRDRRLTAEHHTAVNIGLATLSEIRTRLGFLTGAFDLAGVTAAGDGFDADLILIDYLQRLHATDSDGRPFRDKRSMTNTILDTFRQFAAAGRGLLVLSSVGRQPSGKHGKSSYDGLGLASFKETGECEFAADDAFILAPPVDGWATLKHVKARHTEQMDIRLRAELAFMRFDPESDGTPKESADLLDKARKLVNAEKPKRGSK